MKQYIKKYLEKLLLKEKNISRLAASFCVGTFIALTPTLGVQSYLVAGLCWLAGLNIAVAVAALWLVNNPVTMVPIYVVGYAIGVWVLSALNIDLVAYNPWFMDRFNAFLAKFIDSEKYFGSELCFWCLFVGGTLFGLMVALPLYPLLKRLLQKLALQLEEQKLRS